MFLSVMSPMSTLSSVRNVCCAYVYVYARRSGRRAGGGRGTMVLEIPFVNRRDLPERERRFTVVV
jgi:hypothetical protein